MTKMTVQINGVISMGKDFGVSMAEVVESESNTARGGGSGEGGLQSPQWVVSNAPRYIGHAASPYSPS